AIATVIATSGSSPRPPGSLLIVRDDLEILGSISGGCVEAEVIELALEVIKTNRPARLEFGPSSSSALRVGLACGGRIEVLIQAAPAGLLSQLVAARGERRPCALVTELP